MSVYSKQNEKARAKFLKQGTDFYYAKVTSYERRHVECDTEIRSRQATELSRVHAECACSKWEYDPVNAKMEKIEA